jgi:DNA-binding XRE family transcriptional regulator
MRVADLEAIEAGRSDPGLRVMAPIARALRIDLDDLVPPSQD